MKYVGWIAVGGIGAGIIASSLLAVTSANGDDGFNWKNLNRIRLLGMTGNCYDGKSADTDESEHHWAWDGGDSVTISVPGIVHYRRGEGNDVIVRGDPKLVGHVHVHDGRIEMSCGFGSYHSSVDITLPGRDFHDVSLAGSARLEMENLNQPELALNIGGSGSARVNGNAEKVSTVIGGSGNVIFADLAMKTLDVTIAGSGDIQGKGSSDVADVSVNGSGDVDLTNVPIREITIGINGSGGVEAAPKDKADINIRGSGNVTLLTHPEHISTSIIGSGRLVQLSSKGT